MKGIILTGYGKKEFHKMLKKDEQAGCYLCKRGTGSEGVYLTGEYGQYHIESIELDFEWVEVFRGEGKFKFLLCKECLLLISGIAENFAFPQKTAGDPIISLN